MCLTNGRVFPTIRSMDARPGYELADTVEVATPEQLKAIGDDTRSTILGMLNERAATTTQLAASLGRPKGSVGYHLKVLEEAGLVRVVRTAKVRALTEKYYGRTARTFLIKGPPDEKDPFFMLNEAMRHCRLEDDEPLPMFTLRQARIPRERAAEFAERMVRVAEEFVALEPGGDVVHGFLAGVFATDRPALIEEDA